MKSVNSYSSYKASSTHSEVIFDLVKAQAAIAAFDVQMARDDFWEHVEEAREVLKRRAQLQVPADRWQKLAGRSRKARLPDLAEEADDAEVLRSVEGRQARPEIAIELESLLSRMDAANALLSITPAGGTSGDWAQYRAAIRGQPWRTKS